MLTANTWLIKHYKWAAQDAGCPEATTAPPRRARLIGANPTALEVLALAWGIYTL